MQYIIDDTPIIEADVLVKQPPFISSEVLVPIKTISHEETPTVTPLQIIDYGSSSIECAFDVTTEQADEVVKGVLCGTENPPTFENADYRLLHGQGSMDLAFAGLHYNTEYYLRPYALSNLGYKYGDVLAQRTSSSPIPSEYQLVEYLESTGTQYINTRYFPNISDNILFDVSFVQNLPVQMMGCMAESGGQYLRTHIGNYQNLLSIWIDTSGSNRIGKDYDNGRHIYEFTRTLCKFDSSTANNSNIYPYLPVFLFARNYNGVSHLCIARVYHFSAGNSRDMYPVYRIADNKPGMYDIVNNEFYTNAGTGEFIVGPDKEWEE